MEVIVAENGDQNTTWYPKEAVDAVYKERNLCVALIANLALWSGDKVGIKRHEGEDWEDEWRNVLIIDLPDVGQISWHLHDSELGNFPGIEEYTGSWDGHTTDEKYERIKKYIQS